MKIQRPGRKQVILTQTKPPLSQQYPSPSNSWRIFILTVCGLIAERSPMDEFLLVGCHGEIDENCPPAKNRRDAGFRSLSGGGKRDSCFSVLLSRPAPAGRGASLQQQAKHSLHLGNNLSIALLLTKRHVIFNR